MSDFPSSFVRPARIQHQLDQVGPVVFEHRGDRPSDLRRPTYPTTRHAHPLGELDEVDFRILNVKRWRIPVSR